MVAVDAEDRKEKPLPLIRMTARIEPEWLIDLFPDRVKEHSSVMWNRVAERVDAVSALLYDELVIQESRGAVPEAQAAAELLAQKAMEAGIERFVDMDALNEFMGRVEFAGFEMPDVPQALRDLCFGLRSFAELKKSGGGFVFRAGTEDWSREGCVRSLRQTSACRMAARLRFTMSAANRHGSHPACRTSSACATRRGSGRSERR